MCNPFGRLDVWILQKCNLAYLRQFLICCSTAVQSHEAVRASLALFVRWRRVRGAGNVQLISDYHQGVSDCKSIPNVGHWPCTVMDSMATHRNTKPSHTHSPMAGALLQISTICCSSKAKSDGQVIQKTQQWQWGHCLWIIWPLVDTI